MKYMNVKAGTFLSRPSRFIAYCEVDGKVEKCHLLTARRCKEILVEGAKVYIRFSDNPPRSTNYDIIAAVKGDRLVSLDSCTPDIVTLVGMGIIPDFLDVGYVRRKFPYGNTRIDFLATEYKKRYLIEVEGVTLEDNGVARFPDAPTKRGVKQIRELIKSIDDGYIPYLLFVILMDNVDHFEPNRANDPAYADALREAYDAGVKIMAYTCIVKPDTIRLKESVKVIL